MCIHQDSAAYAPFDVVKKVLRDLVYVENFIPGEVEVEATPQSHLPQFLGALVGIQAAVAQQETDYKNIKRTQSKDLFLQVSAITRLFSNLYKFV